MDSSEQSNILRSLTETLEGLLAWRVGVVEASRQVSSARHTLGQDNHPLFMFFTGVDADTDRFPLGSVRQHWATDALARYDQERELAEQRWRPLVLEPAAELLAWVRARAR